MSVSKLDLDERLEALRKELYAHVKSSIERERRELIARMQVIVLFGVGLVVLGWLGSLTL